MTHFKARADAIWHQGRRLVPTTYGEREGDTKWVNNWDEFRQAGGTTHFNEDQTEIYLTLPEGWKFGIQFSGGTMAPRKEHQE